MAKQYIYFDARKLKRELNKILDRKIRSVRKDKELYRDLLNLLGEKLEPYIPYDTGKLNDSVRADIKNGLVYTRHPDRGRNKHFDVATHVYNGIDGRTGLPLNYQKTVHPLATDHWDKVGIPIIWDSFVQEAADLVSKSMRKA